MTNQTPLPTPCAVSFFIHKNRNRQIICKTLTGLAVLILIFGVLSGCSMNKMAVSQMGGLMKDGFPTYMKETDPLLVRDAMPANLKMIEALLEINPDDQTLLMLACQGFSAYAFMFIEENDPKRAKKLYQRAQKYGFAMLRHRTLVPDSIYDLTAWDKQLSNADIDDVPAIFWTAFAWGGKIQLDKESPASLADIPFAIRLVEQAGALDPAYWFAGPDTFLGFYHGSVPKPIGGKPDLSKQHFEKALALTGRNALIIQVLYARSYAIQVQNRDLYIALLTEVIKSEKDVLPEAALSNAIARTKAEKLINKADDYF
jgi:tetratricopeptide (TPR) repeat protein